MAQIHPTAIVDSGAELGSNVVIGPFCIVDAGAIIGEGCILGHSVYVDSGAVVGNNVKLQNRVSIYRGVTLEDGVFVGPHVSFTNDKYPRSITPEGDLVDEDDWQPVPTPPWSPRCRSRCVRSTRRLGPGAGTAPRPSRRGPGRRPRWSVGA